MLNQNYTYTTGDYICTSCGALVKGGNVHICPNISISWTPPLPVPPESLKDYIQKRLDEINERLDTLIKVFHLIERLEALYSKIEEKEKDGN